MTFSTADHTGDRPPSPPEREVRFIDHERGVSATVCPLPGEGGPGKGRVAITCEVRDVGFLGDLTPEDARVLASALHRAADEAEGRENHQQQRTQP